MSVSINVVPDEMPTVKLTATFGFTMPVLSEAAMVRLMNSALREAVPFVKREDHRVGCRG